MIARTLRSFFETSKPGKRPWVAANIMGACQNVSKTIFSFPAFFFQHPAVPALPLHMAQPALRNICSWGMENISFLEMGNIYLINIVLDQYQTYFTMTMQNIFSLILTRVMRRYDLTNQTRMTRLHKNQRATTVKMTVRGTMVRSEVCNSWCFCLES